MRRWGSAAAIAAAAALALSLAAGSAQARGPSLQRAIASYHALQHWYYVPRHKLYKGEPFTHAWPFSQALAATVRMSELQGVGGRYTDDVRERLSGLDRYWDGESDPPGYSGGVLPPLGRGGAKYYDDNEWIGLELVRRWKASHPGRLLSRAEQIFDLAVYGWDSDETNPCPGGVVFSQSSSNTDRNTITNAPAAQLATELYKITGKREYLDWATRFYNWVQTCMRNQRGLYEDHITFDGDRDRTIWSYNQGVMVGAKVLLYRATGEKEYLRSAKRSARVTLGWFTQNRLRHQPAAFVAILFDNLLSLDALRPDSRIRGAAASYANWAWRSHRNRHTNAFFFPARQEPVLNQAAMVRIYALLARIDR
jgi:Glycosyl hydrolase family 76